MPVQTATSNFGWQNKFSTTLSSGITASDTTIPLTSLPTPSEGFLVIEPDSSTNWEVIYYTSKTGSAVVCTSVASGRGQDDSTAQSHSAGATVRMDTTAGMFEVLQNMSAMTPGSAGGTAFASGWTLIPSTVPNTVTYNGNRSYTCVVNSTDLTSYISAGMRVRTTRTVAAPTQCTSLNGTTQYYSKTSPAGMTFTNNPTFSAWIKVSSYLTSYAMPIINRRNAGTSSGFSFGLLAGTGQPYIIGLSGGSFRQYSAYQSIPLNKWVHLAATMDMNANTSSFYIDGVLVPSALTNNSGTPTSLTQAGNLEIGANSGVANEFFPGKIAQAAIFSAALSASTIQGYYSQGLSGSETSLISAYSFNNSINDLNTTNANNLTANGSAVATNADSPFGGQADGTISSTLDYGIITKISYSTNTTMTVQVPEGCTIPTTGGVSALSYSIQKAPYGMPVQRSKWRITSVTLAQESIGIGAIAQWYGSNSKLNIPVGEYKLSLQGQFQQTSTVSGTRSAWIILDSNPTNNTYRFPISIRMYVTPSSTSVVQSSYTEDYVNISTPTTYTVYGGIDAATGSETWLTRGDQVPLIICAENAYL